MRGYWFLGVAAATILSGCMLFSYAVGQAESTLRKTMLNTVGLLVQTINPSDVRSLTGAKADLQTPAYQRLKKHLVHQHGFLPDVRLISLMKLRNKQTLVLVDSEPEESAEYSPPGEVYSEASEQLLEGIRSGTHFIEGLCVDRWGIWMSFYSPVKDHENSETLVFLALDMDAYLWSDTVRKSGLMPLMLTVIILFLLTAIH